MAQLRKYRWLCSLSFAFLFWLACDINVIQPKQVNLQQLIQRKQALQLLVEAAKAVPAPPNKMTVIANPANVFLRKLQNLGQKNHFEITFFETNADEKAVEIKCEVQGTPQVLQIIFEQIFMADDSIEIRHLRYRVGKIVDAMTFKLKFLPVKRAAIRQPVERMPFGIFCNLPAPFYFSTVFSSHQ